MVAMYPSSFMDMGFSLDRIVLAIVVGVLVLALYEASVLIAAILATRADRSAPGPAAHGSGQPHRR